MKLFDLFYLLKVTRRYRRVDPYGYATKDYEHRRRQEIRQLLQTLQRPGPSLLDIGCSEGLCTLELAPLFDEVVALDLSLAAIRRARAHAKVKQLSHVSFHTGNIRHQQFNRLFGVVFAGDVLYSLGRQRSEEAFVRLIHQLVGWVKPGGYLLLAHAASNPAEYRERVSYRRLAEGAGMQLQKEYGFEDRCLISLLRKNP